MLLAPIGNPEPRDASRLPARSVLQNASHFEVSTGDPHPSGHPHIFLDNGPQTVKMQFATIPRKIQKESPVAIVYRTELPFGTQNLKDELSCFRFLHESTMCGFYWNVIMFDGIL